ncbi:hypothetical protein BsWGS_01878 [Bradybaena similaris]
MFLQCCGSLIPDIPARLCATFCVYLNCLCLKYGVRYVSEKSGDIYMYSNCLSFEVGIGDVSEKVTKMGTDITSVLKLASAMSLRSQKLFYINLNSLWKLASKMSLRSQQRWKLTIVHHPTVL